MSIPFEKRCKDLIVELHLGTADEVQSIAPLTGGVSSEIALATVKGRKICVKFALEELNVAESWRAQVYRNQAEYQWLRYASSVVDGVTPELYGCSQALNGFAMEFIEGTDVYQWKSALLEGVPDTGEARKVGGVLGLIHRASAHSEEVKKTFQNQEDFYSLRLDPYLNFTKNRHPELAGEISDVMDMLIGNNLVLVHGDVSPKNILFRRGKPILLDAECATVGDPSFDIAFCLNHLALKAVHLASSRKELLSSMRAFWDAYHPHVHWESVDDVEKRVCRLLPALMLARIDGKSPVEYLDEAEQNLVRSMAVSLLKAQGLTLDQLIEQINDKLESMQ